MSNHHKDAEIASSLSRAGIGRAFHQRRLDEFGAHGVMLRDWVSSEGFRIEIAAGQGYTLVGDVLAYDLTVVLARACHLKKVKCRVVQLSRLAEMIQDGDTGHVDEAEALFITRFYDPQYAAPPMEPWLAVRLETFLMEWVEGEQPLVLHTAAPLRGCPWWSRLLISRLANKNREMVIQ